ncbi:uncharacterized protein [Gossypium hirsutum]|uniref:Uncharacterized protein n=1 Tax=Gossypium hirsutum TaxID=3635 RepID=A0ABM3AM52_GOSHI|nr:uncharacterized protein LOC107944190 [Gossypium hirsutum]
MLYLCLGVIRLMEKMVKECMGLLWLVKLLLMTNIMDLWLFLLATRPTLKSVRYYFLFLFGLLDCFLHSQLSFLYSLNYYNYVKFFTSMCFFPKFSRNQKEMASRRRCCVGCLYGRLAQCWNL